MPIRPEMRCHYSPGRWAAISAHIRFEVDGGRCRLCRRPHLQTVRRLDDGRWFDSEQRTWRDGSGLPAAWPTIEDYGSARLTRVVLAAAHLDHRPGHDPEWNLATFCQVCHLHYDREHHRRQRWLTFRRRYALGDLFLGDYARLAA